MAAARQASKKTTPSIYSSPKDIFTQNPSFTILTVLLIIAAFYIGTLTQKVNNLEKAGTAQAPQAAQQGVQAQVTPGAKVDVALGHLPILGNSNAKVTVIEFADFQCPFCKQWYSAVEPNLIKDYVNSGKVKFAFRHYAFLGQESTFAAEASECANEQGKFWDFHNYLYEHQGQENSGTFTKDKLESIAQTMGLDSSKFNDCLESDKYQKQVASDMAEGQKAGVNGTPATFVDGQLVSGAQPYDTFKSMIDQELSKK